MQPQRQAASMKLKTARVSVRGRSLEVPALDCGSGTLIVFHRFLAEAVILGEEWTPTAKLPRLEEMLNTIRRSPIPIDILSFSEDFRYPKPRYKIPCFYDNLAVIPLSTYDRWYRFQVDSDLRKDLKRAICRGISVVSTPLTNELVAAIKAIYDETPVRQGRKFWHFNKSLEDVRRENSSFQDRAEFLTAVFCDEVIGFLKLVYVDDVAKMMQILSMESHRDKRPNNALIAKAVQIASERGCSYLTYGRMVYDGQGDSSVTFFKKRNGFLEVRYPRYSMPLTPKGAIAVRLGLHRSFKRFLPGPLVKLALRARAWYVRY